MTPADTAKGAQRRPKGRPYRQVTDTRSVSMLGIGMVVGAVIGAGIALLVAPESGAATRRRLSQGAGTLRSGRGVWTKLGRELRRAAAAKRKTVEIEAKRKEIAEGAAGGADSIAG
ncbi:MAG: YtxH domain-containing protein [Gemmatimonadales bacterium]